MRDLALEAAFTSMSLRDRWRAPGVEDTLEPITLPEKTLHRQELQTWQNGMFVNTISTSAALLTSCNRASNDTLH